MSKPFSIRKRLLSFKYALNGIIISARGHNFIIHIVLAVAAIVLGFFLGISYGEWLAVIIVICIVIASEIFNTSIETIVDIISPEQNDMAKNAKDMAAGAVLVSAVGALLTGLLIFGPKLIKLI